MRSRSERKNKAVIRSLLAKFMVLLMIVNIFNVINPAIVRADDTKHFENNAIMVTEGGITAKNYNNGKFDVEMLVKGDGSTTTEEKKLDVVLVVDRSYGNMSRSGRMAEAKAEAARLVDYFLQSGNNKVKVGLVSFAGGDREAKNPIVNHFDLTDNASVLKNKIANYSTAPYAKRIPVLEEAFTQAGLIEANKLFVNSGNNKKIIVLITGGKPTLSYDEAKEKLIDDPGGMTGNTPRVVNNTITEANEIKTKNNVEIFSIGVKFTPLDYKAKEILEKIASNNRYYENNIHKSVVDEVIENLKKLKDVKKVNSIENGVLKVKISDEVKSELNPTGISLSSEKAGATPAEKADLDTRVNNINKSWNQADKTFTFSNINLGKDEVLTIKYSAELQDQYKNGEFHKILESATLYPKGENGFKEVYFNIPKVKDAVYTTPSITKIWRGTVANDAKFGLFKKGGHGDERLIPVQGAVPTITKNNNEWTVEFKDAKINDDNGKAIQYVIKEIDEDGTVLEDDDIIDFDNRAYRVSESKDGKTITNTELINITVEKKWADGVPETATKSIGFNIVGNDEEEHTYILNEKNNWTETVKDLPLYDENGTEIKYSVVETRINGEDIKIPSNVEKDAEGNFIYYHKAFKITISKNAKEITKTDNITITNSIKTLEQNIPDKRIIKVVKNWGNTSVSKRKEVEVTLYKLNKDGEMVKADGIDPITLNNNSDTDKDWQGEFVAPLKDENGEFVQYYAFETRIDNVTSGAVKFEPDLYNDGYKIGEYSVRISELTSGDPNAKTGDYGFYILNESEDATDEPVKPEEKISINVTKTWTDSTPLSYRLPVNVRLFIENGEYLVPVTAVSELTLNEDNNWTGKFENLEKVVGDNGKEIKYYVYEVGVGTNNTINAVGFISKPNTYKIGDYDVNIAKNGTTNVTITNDRKPDQTSGGSEVVPGPLNPGTDNNTNNQQAPDTNTPDVNVTDDKTPQGTVNTDKTMPDEDTDETGIADIDEDETPQGSIDSGKDTASDKKTKVEDKVNEDDTPQGKTALPKTGGTNATIFGVIGLGLIGLALLIKRRR